MTLEIRNSKLETRITRSGLSGLAVRSSSSWAGLIRRMLILWGVIVLVPGCVHRRLTITSNPPGARVLLDGEEIGETPTAVDFTHYGTRELVLQKDGYETLKTLQTVPPPWYQVLPFEFFADNLLPFQLTNRHEFNFQLHPSPTVPLTQGLRDRATQLRAEADIHP